MKIQGVIFDMDGLMFDTERLFSHYWPDACRDYGIPRKEEFVQAVRGSSGEKMLACVRRYYGEELDAQAFCHRCYEYVDDYLKTTVPKKKGLDELLAWLKAEHPYEVPQLLLRMEAAHPDYAGWVAAQVDIKKVSCQR